MKKLQASFKAVFTGDPTNRQFIDVFVVIISFALAILSAFIIR